MKTIEIEGEKYGVPNWVNYIAMDPGLQWYGYEIKPVVSHHYVSWLADGGRILKINHATVPRWTETLRKV